MRKAVDRKVTSSPPRTLSNRAVNTLKVEKDTVFWDRSLTGFGVRVYPTGGKVYLAHARSPQGPKRVRVGRHGVMNAEEARKRAALIIARIRAGESAVPESMAGGPTVAEVARRFRNEYVAVRLKPASARRLSSAIDVHILPAFGKKPLRSVKRKDVLGLHQRLCDTPNQANRVVRTLSQMYRLAEDWGLLPAPHAPGRRSSPGSAVWTASARGSPPCSPCGNRAPSSNAGAADCAGPGETTAHSSDTCVVFASSSIGFLRPPMMRPSAPDRGTERQRSEENEENEETFSGSFSKKTPPKKTTISDWQNDYTFRLVLADSAE